MEARMKFLLLHLSDIHFRGTTSSNPVLLRTEQVVAAMGSLLVTPSACFVVISGDIAFSGKAEEYVFAEQFFTNLSQKLKDRFHLSKIDLILVPGNHDCNFAGQTSLREIVLQDVSRRRFDPLVIETCLQVQSDFWGFVNRIQLTSQFTTPEAKVYTPWLITAEGVTIQFNLLNTALLSRSTEQQGTLLFPLEVVQSSTVVQAPPDLAVSVLHHPYNWFEASNARDLRQYLESCSDIVLTGHEHEPDSFVVVRQSREEVEYVEGAILQDHQDSHLSGFNIALIDVEQSIQRIYHFCWTRNVRYEQEVSPTELPFLRNAFRLRNQYVLKAEFEEEIHDPGANYTHSAKETITLDDIFVYPDLRLLTTDNDRKPSPKLVRENISTFIANQRHVLLLGRDKSGKSTIAKILFQDLRKRGLLPVYLLGGDLKRADEDSVRKTIRKVFEAQYSSPNFEAYSQLDPSNRAIIVDDLQDMPLNSRGRDRVVRVLEDLFHLVILIGDDSARFDDLVDRKDDDLHLWSYTACEILPLGHLKRSDLIKKWFFLGRSLTHDEHDLLRQVQAAERLISELVGRFLTPSYPIFLLVLLQQLEAHKRLDITSSSGSYGFLYETLLTISLSQASRLKLDLDTQYSYLSVLAFSFFQNRTKKLSRDQVYDWHLKFCRDYSRRLDFEDVLTNFTTAGVLAFRDGVVSFKYPYLYYYFLGRYFRDHLEDNEVKTSIATMASRLHHEESANVLLFLSYLSKSPLILESILQSARRLFSSEAECNIETDTIFLGQIIADIPKFVLDGDNPEARRRHLLARKDQNEFNDPDPPQDPPPFDEVDTDEKLADILKINVAFKTMQILGQILRNYPGSLIASDKLRLGRETYSLGLRLLKFMLDALEKNKEEIVQLLFTLLQERHPTWSEARLKTRVGDTLFNLTEGIVFLVMKHIADSAGDEILALTFDELLREATNPSYRFIDLSIRLFHFSQFPENEVIDLYKDFEQKPFPTQLLRHNVWYFFYLFTVRTDLVQSMCRRLQITIHPALLHDQRPKLVGL